MSEVFNKNQIKNTIYIFFFSVTIISSAQKISVTPKTITDSDEVTITVSEFDFQKNWGVEDIYLWAWFFDSDDEFVGNATNTGSSFGNSPESAKFIKNSDSTFTYKFNISSFFDTSDISKFGFLIKSKNGSNKSIDYVYKVGGFQLVLLTPEEKTSIHDLDDIVSIKATTSSPSIFSLLKDGIEVHSTSFKSTNYDYDFKINKTSNFNLIASSENGTASLTFTLAIVPTITKEALPDNLLDGINLDRNDKSKATFVLYAPNKKFVHLIGDFNNWKIDDNYLMKKDDVKDRFWIELTNLTPGENHLYQYLIDFNINVADPYSTLILDGFNNDQFIDEITFPNITPYPENQTHAISVFNTREDEYNWKNLNFKKPKKEDLVIYELLIRDFDSLHSFQSIQNRLDYLQNLGINAIELMPVNEFDGNISWGYNPSFHMALDKYYGTKNAFKSLIDECHSRGIAVILDVVYNHASDQNPYYRMWNTENGSENPFFNQQATHTYSVYNDFNHGQQIVKEYVNRTLNYWIREFKIDGMRWDLTKGFTQNCNTQDQNCTNSIQLDRIEILKKYADIQWSIDEDFYVIFEHLGEIEEENIWANYRIDEGKGIMLWNKQTAPYNEATLGFHNNSKSDFTNASYLNKGFQKASAITYMESHDEERLMYKNIQFGNKNEKYNVRNTETALSRIEAAGAFFFTIPGPKMIWQFSELGYDISINYNGRTGEKPILWEYEKNNSRKKIYSLWSKLIALKKNEPIFKTSNFRLDLKSESGLKNIQLISNNAEESGLKYVNIIGNFGIIPQEITPDFQKSGVWYEFLKDNLKFVVIDTQKPILLQPGEFRIFGDTPSILFGNSNDPDDDNDGVLDIFDQCPNTTLGSSVDLNGCEIFLLPANNFSVAVTSSTCVGSENGSISISAQNKEYSYTATISGQSSIILNASNNFEASISGLGAGIYDVCFTIAGIDSYNQCFSVTIIEPVPLSTSAKIDLANRSVDLSLKGSTSYNILLNGAVIKTTASNLSLDLKPGMNYLSISTDLDCQGTYFEEIFVSEDVLAYPNPTDGMLQLYIGGSDDTVTLNVYDINSQNIISKSFEVSSSRVIEADISRFKTGIYFFVLDGKTIKTAHKIIKNK